MRYLALAALAIALVIACRHVDVAALTAVLRETAWLPFAPLVVVLLVARTAARARRTQLLLDGRVGYGAVVQLSLAGYAAATLVPGPSEGLLWCTQLAKRRGFSLRELARFQLADKSIVAASLGLVALALVSPHVAFPLALAALAAALPGLVVPLGWLVVSHLVSIAMIAACLTAVGLPATPVACAEVFLGTALAGLLVFVPGQLGTFESAFTLAALHHGMPPAAALAAGMLYHAVDLVPPTLAGLPALIRITLARRNIGATPP